MSKGGRGRERGVFFSYFFFLQRVLGQGAVVQSERS